MRKTLGARLSDRGAQTSVEEIERSANRQALKIPFQTVANGEIIKLVASLSINYVALPLLSDGTFR